MVEWHGDDIDPENMVDEVHFEPENNEPPKGGDAEVRVAKLKAEIEQLKAERQEYLDGWQRSKADYVNLLKRSEQEAGSREQKGLVRAVETLLPAFDALERSKEHGEVPEGFLAIAKQLEGGFAALGLKPIGVVGEQFDPAHHDAMGQDAVQSQEADNGITAVLEKGWGVGDYVIRPAKVRVGKFEG